MEESDQGLKLRMWQQLMIRAACSDRLTAFMHKNPLSRRLSRRFVGGANRAEVVHKIVGLQRQGPLSSVYYLGEYVDQPELVAVNVREIIAAVEEVGRAQLPVFLSVDPTQIGYTISEESGLANARRIGAEMMQHPSIRFMMIDMEDWTYVEPTLRLYDTLRAENVPVAITLQTYLKRTAQDFERLAHQGAAIRLVKGAFVESSERAWTRKREIDDVYLHTAQQALSAELKEARVYPIFATHDHRILEQLKPLIRANGWQPDEYEIEMLLGVRTELQHQLAREGHTVRVYVPFGTAWWPYTARRIGENPANARFVIQALWGR